MIMEEEEGDKEGEDTAWGEVFARLDKGTSPQDPNRYLDLVV